MLADVWSWSMVAVGVTGIYLAGSKRAIGWAVNFFGQALWAGFGLVDHKPAFVVSAVIYACVFARNYRRWYATARTPEGHYRQTLGGVHSGPGRGECPNGVMAVAIYGLLERRHPNGCTSTPQADHSFCRCLRSELDRLAGQCASARGCTEDRCTMEGR